MSTTADGAAALCEPLFVGGWRVQPGFGAIRQNGTVTHLEPKAMEVLLYLAARGGQVVPKEELIRAVWGEVFVSDQVLANAISQLRHAFGDSPQNPRLIQTVPKRGYCLIAEVKHSTEHVEARPVVSQQPGARPVEGLTWVSLSRRRAIAAGGAILLLSLAALVASLRTEIPRARNSIVIAGFRNSTGNPIFDETLLAALHMNLENSNRFTIAGEADVAAARKLMKRATGALSPDETQHLCARVNSQVAFAGTIDKLGTGFVIVVSAEDCATANIIAREQVQAFGEDQVLRQLRDATSRVIGKVAPSKMRDHPLADQGTTMSLDALKAYATGIEVLRRSGEGPSIPYFRRATDLDPDFALAYARLGHSYNSMGETVAGRQYIQRAYELRRNVSEDERLSLEGSYNNVVLGDHDRVVETILMRRRDHPERPESYFASLFRFIQSGEFQRVLSDADTGRKISARPIPRTLHEQTALLALGRFAELKTNDVGTTETWDYLQRQNRYLLAFVEGDSAGMTRWESGVSDPYELARMLRLRADTEAYFGRMHNARELTRQSALLARAAERNEVAEVSEAQQAWREAQVDSGAEAKRRVDRLSNSRSVDVRILAALALARNGEVGRAASLADRLESENPKNTFLREKWLPAIRAEIELSRGNAARAIELLQTARRFDTGLQRPVLPSMVPPFVRGRAYLQAGRASEAIVELRRIIGQPGVVANCPIGSLTHLYLARAYRLSGSVESSRTEYEKFLRLWSEADSDLPLLHKAKDESASAL